MPKLRLKNIDRSGAAHNDVVTYKTNINGWGPFPDPSGSFANLPAAPKQTIVTAYYSASNPVVIVPAPDPGYLRFIGNTLPYYPVIPVPTGIKLKNASDVAAAALEWRLFISGAALTSSLTIDEGRSAAGGPSVRYLQQPGDLGPGTVGIQRIGFYIPTFLSSSETLYFEILSESYVPESASLTASLVANYYDIPEDNIVIKRTLLTTSLGSSSYVDIIPPAPPGFVHLPFPEQANTSFYGSFYTVDQVSPIFFTRIEDYAVQIPPQIVFRLSGSGSSETLFDYSASYVDFAAGLMAGKSEFIPGGNYTDPKARLNYPVMCNASQSYQARLRSLEDGASVEYSASVATTVYWVLPN